MTMEEYCYVYPGTNVTLKQVQEVEYEILVEFDKICKECNIPYQLFAGTLLGAVRHGGFIPWDDDIDVCMKRSDFELFIKKCPELLSNNYFLQTSKTDPKSVVQFAKIRKNGTVYENSVDNLADTNTGIWIDIFPLDNTKAGTFSETIQCIEANLLYSMITSTVDMRIKASKKLWKRILRRIFSYIMKLVPKHIVEQHFYNVITRYNNQDVGYIANFTNGVSWNKPRKTRRSKDFYDIILMKFEDSEFPVPRNYDEVLTSDYGNYMKLPSEVERKPLHGVTKVSVG